MVRRTPQDVPRRQVPSVSRQAAPEAARSRSARTIVTSIVRQTRPSRSANAAVGLMNALSPPLVRCQTYVDPSGTSSSAVAIASSMWARSCPPRRGLRASGVVPFKFDGAEDGSAVTGAVPLSRSARTGEAELKIKNTRPQPVRRVRTAVERSACELLTQRITHISRRLGGAIHDREPQPCSAPVFK